MKTQVQMDVATAQAALLAAQEAAKDTPEARVLAAELDSLAAHIAVLDGKIAELAPEKEAALRNAAAVETRMADLQKELADAQAVRRRVLGRIDSLQFTRRSLLGQRSVKAEQLARLRERAPLPVVRWAGG